jgi:hypothetical protein
MSLNAVSLTAVLMGGPSFRRLLRSAQPFFCAIVPLNSAARLRIFGATIVKPKARILPPKRPPGEKAGTSRALSEDAPPAAGGPAE